MARGASLLRALLRPGALRGGERDLVPRPPRPPGRLVWLACLRAEDVPGARDLAIGCLDAGWTPLLTCADSTPAEPSEDEDGLLVRPHPATPPAQAELMSHFRPDALVCLGTGLEPGLVASAAQEGAPVLWLGADLPAAEPEGWARNRAIRAAMRRCAVISAQDPAALVRLHAAGGRDLPVRVGGALRPPLALSEEHRATRAELTRQIGARPVWLAAACPQAEEDTVLTAHAFAMRHAHRLLLVLVPAESRRTPALAGWLEREGWSVARHGAGEPLTPDTQILLAEGPTDLDLWCRIAPITYIGGTLTDMSRTSPMLAAGLGSAVVHGQETEPESDTFRLLTAARATRLLRGKAALGPAISELLNPDLAAQLAQAAWDVATRGVPVREAALALIGERLAGKES